MPLSEIHQPHDRFVRNILAYPEIAQDLFRRMMTDQFLQSVDLTRLCNESDIVTDHDLGMSVTDLVFSTPVVGKDENAFLVLLLEHKSDASDIDPFMMELYRLRVMQHIAKQRKMKNTYPLVMPYLLYHGEKPYEGPFKVTEMIEGEDFMVEHAMKQPFFMMDLSITPDEVLLDQTVGGIALYLLKHIRSPNILSIYQIVLRTLKGIGKLPGGKKLLNTFHRYLMSGSRVEVGIDQVVKIAVNSLGTSAGGDVMTIAERLREEGIQIGEERGIQIGEERGIQIGEERGIQIGEERGIQIGEERTRERTQMIALNMIQIGMDLQTISQCTNLDMEELKRLQTGLQ